MQRTSFKTMFIGVCLALSLALSSCASTTGGKYSQTDPLEPLNRATFSFNEAIDAVLLKPLAMIYKTVVPVIFQDIITNFIDNLTTPVSVINYILQGDVDMAGMTMGRFMTNSVFGLLGTLDVASALDIPETPTDFGLTLAKWGVTESPYFVLPVLGPSTVRDGIGKGVDFFMQPVNWLAMNPNNEKINDLDWARVGVEAIEVRASALELIDDIDLNSVDKYATMRTMYLQNRNYRITGKKNSNDAKANYDFDFNAE